MVNLKNTKTSKLALGGICLALTVVFMFAGSIVPGIELTLFAISSLFTAVMILETDVRGGLILFAGASILGFILVPNKAAVIPYIFFFGYYGILKFYIEKLTKAVLQITVKVLFFAAVMCTGIFGLKELFFAGIDIPNAPAVVLIIGGTAILLLYDYIYTLIINFYIHRIKNKGLDNMKLS